MEGVGGSGINSVITSGIHGIVIPTTSFVGLGTATGLDSLGLLCLPVPLHASKGDLVSPKFSIVYCIYNVSRKLLTLYNKL
jgi:hypothetical protein